MPKAEDILRQQRGEQVAAKAAEESARIAKAKLEEHEAKVRQLAIDAGFDPDDPIKGFHDAVDAFNKEKDDFDAEKQRFIQQSSDWTTNYNVNLERLNADQKKFQEQVAAQQVRNKSLDDILDTKTKELDATIADIIERQKIVQVLASQVAEKKTELDNVNDLLTSALRKCKKLVLESDYRKDYYYDLAMSDTWGRFSNWARNLFRDLPF